MHGPYVNFEEQTRKHKVYLIAAIDDYSRVICARGWFWHENSISLEIALKEAIGRMGLPKTIYCDNAAPGWASLWSIPNHMTLPPAAKSNGFLERSGVNSFRCCPWKR
jgi:hypothetical protein